MEPLHLDLLYKWGTAIIIITRSHDASYATSESAVVIATSPECNDAIIATTRLLKSNHLMLKVIHVVISGFNGDFETSALLDKGAGVSLIDASFAAGVGVNGLMRSLRICGAHGMALLIAHQIMYLLMYVVVQMIIFLRF